MERHSGRESLRLDKEGVRRSIKDAANWQELHQAMRQNGLELRQKGNGFVITGPDGLAVKASSVDVTIPRSA